jgi:hypothetical protein
VQITVVAKNTQYYGRSMARQFWNIVEWTSKGDQVAVLQASVPAEPLPGRLVLVEYTLVIGDVTHLINAEDAKILIAARAADD